MVKPLPLTLRETLSCSSPFNLTGNKSVICYSLVEELEPVTFNSCAVVYENDEDFGQLRMIPLCGHSTNLANLNEPLPSAKIDQESLEHLTESQKLELFEVPGMFFRNTWFYRCGDSLYTSEGWF